MVLKQCGQDAMTFLPVPAATPASLSVSMFCWASMLNTNSLPSRRAGSPVHASAGPSTANLTPATCSSSAIALVAFFARSSSAPAQPTQYRYSTSSGMRPSRTGTSKSSSVIHSARLSSAMPHGLPRRSRLLSIVVASCGKADSTRTWWRRIPLMWSMCSMSTGHSFTHAPQFVQDQITSGSITPPASTVPTRGRSASALTASGSLSRASSESARRYGALANAWSRRSRMTCLGDSGLPVTQAGHCDWQRPHSVHVPRSSRPFQVMSSTLPMPNTSTSGSASSKSSTLPPERIGSSGPSAFGRRENSTFTGARKICRCLEYTTMTRNTSTTATWASRNTTSSTLFTPYPSGASACPTICEANAPCAYGNTPVLICAPRYSSSVAITPKIIPSTSHAALVCDPKNRDLRPSLSGLSRIRITVNVMIPPSTPTANRSSRNPTSAQCPIQGSENVRLNSAP